jgi:ketosteroid isomerase-like protein
MAEHPNVDRFRRALDARRRATLGSDDKELLEGLFADDVVWHGAANGAAEGVHGSDHVVALWNALARAGDGAPRIDVGDVYADGSHGIAVLELSAGGAHGHRAIAQGYVFHLNAAGKVTELWGLPTDRAIVDAFSAGAAVPEHRNLPLFRTAEETRQRNTFEPEDMANLEQFLREDVVWHGAGDSQWADGARGRAQVIGLFQMFKQATGGSMRIELTHVFADDRHGVSLVEISADRPDRPGRHMLLKEVNLFHLDAEGKALEFWGVPNDPAIMDGFWAP